MNKEATESWQEEFAKAYEELERISQDPERKWEYESRLKWLLDNQQRYDDGVEDGREIGLEEGKKLGLQEGRELGLQKGKELGLQKGKELGLQKGKELGLQEGKELGLQEGLREGERRNRAKVIERMLSRGLLPAEIAELLGTSLQEIEAVGAALPQDDKS